MKAPATALMMILGILGLPAAPAHAAGFAPRPYKLGMAEPGAAHAPSHASMDEVTTRNVAEIMNQIRTMLRQTVQIMNRSRHLDPERTHTLSQIMLHMSAELLEVSRGMDQGTMDRDHISFLQRRMRHIGNLIRSMEQQVGI